MKWIVREQQKKESAFNAGSKARNDVDAILVSEGYKPLVANSKLDESQGAIKKISLQFRRVLEWKNCIKDLESGDTIVIQYPVRNHTLFFGNVLNSLKTNNIKIIGIIHDLESLRLAISENSPLMSKLRFKFEEQFALKYFDKIVVHNEHMKIAIHDFFGIPKEKMINLEIFDYLYTPINNEEHAKFGGPVIIAGNLDKNKCGYVYNLPDDVQFELFGANYDENCKQKNNIQYKGKAKPDELPSVLKGSFGLVWDGPSVEMCCGVFGEYLKYNNPHKASLYLASGIPIIVWKKSALADFVEKHGCGINVESLLDLGRILNELNEVEYLTQLANVKAIQNRLLFGEYTKKAMSITELD